MYKWLVCRHKYELEDQSDFVKHHLIDEDSKTYSLVESSSCILKCKKCGKRKHKFDTHVIEAGLTDFTKFGKGLKE